MMETREQTNAIPKAGVYESVLDRIYHSWQCVSPSRAKPALISAKKYESELQRDHEPTDAQALGTASHAAVLEPDSLLSRFVLWEGGRRFGSEWNDFCRINSAKTILKPDQYEAALKIRDSAQSNPAIRAIISRTGRRELSMRWDQESAAAPVTLQCKGRPDFIADRIYDLKTIRTLSDHAMVSNVVNFNYLLSMGAYRYGREVLEDAASECVLIFVETQPPYDSCVKTLDEEAVDFGFTQWIKACDIIARAQHTNKYPGQSDVETPLVLDDWVFRPTSNLTLSIGGETVEM
jgi:hypothetical protein